MHAPNYCPLSLAYPKGGAPPPPPSRPPQVFELVFLQFEILRKIADAKGAEKFVFGRLRGYVLFYPMCLYSKFKNVYTQIFVESSTMGEKHKKN